MGEGADALGLDGQVRGDDLTAVLEGRLPDGSRLGKEINGNHVHRPGHDLTFSAPKSVSILALIGGDMYPAKTESHYCVPGRLSCVTRLDGLPHSPLAVRVFLAQLNEIL